MKDSKLCNLSALDLQNYQKNRYPWFFLDGALEILPGVSATAFKNFTYNEWFFPIHFKDEPNVPSFIQLECLDQAFLMTFLTMDGLAKTQTGTHKFINAKFKRKIIPGETLEIKAKLESFRRGIAKGFVESFVNEEPACSMNLIVTIPEIVEKLKPL